MAFILALFVLSITVSPDNTDQQHAIDVLRGLPVLLQPPLDFKDDKAGHVKFKNVFTRMLARMKTMTVPDEDAWLRNPAFPEKAKANVQQPAATYEPSNQRECEGKEGVHWHRVKPHCFNSALQPGNVQAN